MGAATVAVVAPNPSPTTLEGTNTWVVGRAGEVDCAVVDPGPGDPAHLAAVRRVVGDRRVAAVLLTHRHLDHAEGAASFAGRVSAPLRASGSGSGDLRDGDEIHAGGVSVQVVATPGHTADSLCLLVAQERCLLTGDTILGRGTTTVDWPDGRLGDYLASLDRIASLTGDGRVTLLLPGHGPPVSDAHGRVEYYRRHRCERLDQVRRAVEAGATDVDAVLAAVYADTPRELWPAAARSVEAQLDHLRHA